MWTAGGRACLLWHQAPIALQAVAHVLGGKAKVACAVLQTTFNVLTCIAFLITASISMQVIANLACGAPQDANISSNNSSDYPGCFNDSWPVSPWRVVPRRRCHWVPACLMPPHPPTFLPPA
jgi:hypothetical protein